MKTFFRRGALTFLTLALLISVTPYTASAASLTEPQIQAILNLLVAFDVPQATINNVTIILHGGSTAAASAKHLRGTAQAKLTVVEYCDTESPFCKTFHSTMRAIFNEYQNSGKLAWEYKSFPLSALYSKSVKEAQALECAASLGGNAAFWQYVDRLYEITPSDNGLDSAKLATIAATAGLSTSAFEKCLDSNDMAARVTQSYNEGIAAGVQGTPASLLVKGASHTMLSGALPYASMKEAIDTLLND